MALASAQTLPTSVMETMTARTTLMRPTAVLCLHTHTFVSRCISIHPHTYLGCYLESKCIFPLMLIFEVAVSSFGKKCILFLGYINIYVFVWILIFAHSLWRYFRMLWFMLFGRCRTNFFGVFLGIVVFLISLPT